MMTTLADRIRNPEFNNWVKSALTLDFARDALKEFVETKNETNHESLIQRISFTCSSCDFNTCANCQNKTCTNKQLKECIKISHVKQSPSFVNTCPKDCLSQPWEFAKCFMPPNGYRGTITADDTDFPGLISVIVNNLDLRAAISHDDRKFNKARDVRNEIMHNSGFAVDDQTFKDYIDIISTMLFCLPITDKTKIAFSMIGELSRGTLTITTKDITHVIDEAVGLLKLRNNEIKDSIREMSELSKLCKQEIKDNIEAGVKTIEHKTEECVDILRDKTEHGLTDIKIETTKATDQLSVKQKEGFDALACKANEEASQLHILHKDNTFALRETAEREREEIRQKAEQEKIAIKREHEMLKGIMKDSVKKLDSDINLIRKKTIKTENIRDEISQNADKIQRTTDTCVTSVQAITKACMESLYKETETFRAIIRDSKSQSENDKRNDIENIRTEFRGEIQEIREVLREIRELKSGKQNKFDDLDTHHDTDERPSNITGMVKVGGDQLAVVDYDNDRVKIINVSNNTITSIVDVKHPMDITCVNDNLLVVSYHQELKFLELKNDILSVGKTLFKSDFNPLGVDYTNVYKVFAVSYYPNSVTIIDLEGNTIHKIHVKRHRFDRFRKATIQFGNDGRILYVTDETKHRIICLNSEDGTTLYRYQHAILKAPVVSLTVYTVNNVYIVVQLSNNIHKFTFSPPDSNMSIFLGKDDGIHHPLAITYCDKKHALYVCHRALGKVVVSIHPL